MLCQEKKTDGSELHNPKGQSGEEKKTKFALASALFRVSERRIPVVVITGATSILPCIHACFSIMRISNRSWLRESDSWLDDAHGAGG
jgi:hypothetical protein